MTTNQKPMLPQVKTMLGKAAADRIAREGGSPRRQRPWTRPVPVKVRLLATLGVTLLAGVAAVSAGALDRDPVAPQLSPEESGVKPGVVPGETQIIHGPNGERIEAGISPCIKSDPSGYSYAELENDEWCFHAPGTVGHESRSEAKEGVIYERQPDGSFKALRRLPAEVR
jgi:hypothetical protein